MCSVYSFALGVCYVLLTVLAVSGGVRSIFYICVLLLCLVCEMWVACCVFFVVRCVVLFSV